MRLTDLDKIEEIAKNSYNAWNLAMATADGTREINHVFKMQELCKAVKAVSEKCEVVEAAPVVHAHWEIETEKGGYKHTICSNCGAEQAITFSECGNKYCDACGARMDEVV